MGCDSRWQPHAWLLVCNSLATIGPPWLQAAIAVPLRAVTTGKPLPTMATMIAATLLRAVTMVTIAALLSVMTTTTFISRN